MIWLWKMFDTPSRKLPCNPFPASCTPFKRSLESSAHAWRNIHSYIMKAALCHFQLGLSRSFWTLHKVRVFVLLPVLALVPRTIQHRNIPQWLNEWMNTEQRVTLSARTATPRRRDIYCKWERVSLFNQSFCAELGPGLPYTTPRDLSAQLEAR